MFVILSLFLRCYFVVLPLYMRNRWKQQNIIIMTIKSIDGTATIDTIIKRIECDAPLTVK